MSPVTAEPGDQDAGQYRREGRGVTDDSAFKKQVRARMAETGEKLYRRPSGGHRRA
jgi:hypothetical protein